MNEQPSQDSVKRFLAHAKAYADLSRNPNVPSATNPTYSFNDYLKWVEIGKMDKIIEGLEGIAMTN
ncbi:MAG: hypothetical protein V4649_16535 [Bacteroidota bacterium]